MFSSTTISDLLFNSPLATSQTVERVPDEVVSLIYPATAPKQAGDLACTLADLDHALELTVEKSEVPLGNPARVFARNCERGIPRRKMRKSLFVRAHHLDRSPDGARRPTD